MKTILITLCAILVASCSNMTTEQKAQWSATGNAVAQHASGILLDEAAARLKETRKHKTGDSKDSTVKEGP